jgi:hypothetical protein
MEFEWEKTVGKWRNGRGFEVAWMDDRAKNQDGRSDATGHPERLIGIQML